MKAMGTVLAALLIVAAITVPSAFALEVISTLDASKPPMDTEETQSISVVLLIDNSASMAQTDPTGLRFAAASQLVDLLEDGDEISVVLFADDSTVLVSLAKVADAPSKEIIKKTLSPVTPAGNTNMRAGLEAGLAELEDGSNSIRFAIFLTDGELHPPNWPSFTAQQQEAERNAVLALGTGFGERKWGLFSVALANAVEPEFLQKLAANSGGLYRAAPEARQLTLVFQEVFAANKLDVFEVLFSDCLVAGEVRSVTFPVREFVSTLSMFVTYTSDLRPAVTLARPDGAPVSRTGGDTRYDVFDIGRPARGTWTVTIVGAAEGESCLTVSSTPRTLLEVVWLRPPSSLMLRAGDPLEIVVRLAARDPETGEERPVADATAGVTVAGPDGRSYEGALSPAGSGEYAGTVSVNGVEGNYAIALVVETKQGALARRGFETSLSATPVGVSSPVPSPTRVPMPAAPPADAATGDRGLALVFLMGPALLVGLAVSWASYAHFGRPTLHGYLQSTSGGKAYDLELRHSRTWWRRPLTIGGPQDDIDLGLGARWARVIASRKGKCFLEAVSADGVVVDDQPLPKGMRCRLYDCSEISLGSIGLIYRSP